MGVLKHRAIRLSIKDRLRDMLTTPDPTTGLAPYHVYYEQQFRKAATGAFTPEFPFIYLLDAYLLPVAQQLDVMQPQIVVEINKYHSRPFEIGNRSGRWIEAYIQVFGQSRGQRDDLGSYVMDYFGNALDIKDYSASNTAGSVVDSAILDDDRVTEDIYTPRLEIEVAGGLLMGWTRTTLRLRPKA